MSKGKLNTRFIIGEGGNSMTAQEFTDDNEV
jgi:hypothetical protein